MIAMVGLVLCLGTWLLGNYLERTCPAVFRWVFLPFVLLFSGLVLLGACVAELHEAGCIPETVDCNDPEIQCVDTPDFVDCTAPEIRCVNAEEDSP